MSVAIHDSLTCRYMYGIYDRHGIPCLLRLREALWRSKAGRQVRLRMPAHFRRSLRKKTVIQSDGWVARAGEESRPNEMRT